MFDIALCGPRPLLACGPASDYDRWSSAPAVKKPAKRKAKRKSTKSK